MLWRGAPFNLAAFDTLANGNGNFPLICSSLLVCHCDTPEMAGVPAGGFLLGVEWTHEDIACTWPPYPLRKAVSALSKRLISKNPRCGLGIRRQISTPLPDSRGKARYGLPIA